MHQSARPQSCLRLIALGILLAGVLGCSTPAERLAQEDPQFGQSVRTALRNQSLPVREAASASGVPYIELENGLDSQQKARPSATNANRSTQNPLARPLGQ